MKKTSTLLFLAIFLNGFLNGLLAAEAEEGGREGSCLRETSIFVAESFFESFLLLPTPSTTKSPHVHVVWYTFMCAGPDSFETCRNKRWEEWLRGCFLCMELTSIHFVTVLMSF